MRTIGLITFGWIGGRVGSLRLAITRQGFLMILRGIPFGQVRALQCLRFSRLCTFLVHCSIPLSFPTPPEGPSRFCSDVLSILDYTNTIYQHMFHAGCVLVRVVIG